jgi:signal transduction histidine kinase
MPSGKYVDEASRGPLAYAAHQEFKRRLASAPDDGDEIWPWWVCLPSFGVAFVILSLALMQRWHAEQSLMLPSLYAALAITPWVYDVVFVLRNWQPMLPLWLFPVLPMVGVPLLIARPVDMDVAPMLLVLLAGEIGSRDAKLRLVAHATGVAAVSLMFAYEAAELFQGAFIWSIGIGFGWACGIIGGALVRKNAELEAAQSELAEKAASDERQRIAREVHDVIAHSLSVTMLHLSAARMATERGRATDALEALQEAERHGRSSLADIRRTVGLLGTEETSTAPPAPSATDLPSLVGDLRTAGLEVALEVAGDLASLPPAAGLDLYRIVQESLTNVAKHAPGAKTAVKIDLTGDEIQMSIRNSAGNGSPVASPLGNGLGLRGMAERAASLGGTLRTENRDGWTVSLVAPRPSA